MESLSSLDLENKNDPNEFDLTVASLLVGLGAEKYIDVFKKHNIGQCTLVELGDEDLQIIGVDDKEIRDKIISEVRNLPIYEESSEYLNEKNSDGYTKEEVAQILENTAKHLYHMELCVVSNKVALKKNKNAPDFLVHKNLYASDVGIKTIDAILDTLQEMEQILDEHYEPSHKKQKRRKKKMVVTIAGSGVVCTLAYLFYKSLKNLNLY